MEKDKGFEPECYTQVNTATYVDVTYQEEPVMDTFFMINLTALGIFVLFSVVVLSFGKVFEEKRHVRNRCPVSYYGAHTAQSRNGSDDNSVYVISSNPPSYDELLADKPPDYNDVSYLPSYEQYQRLAGQRSSCELNLNDCTACGNADFVEVNESQVHDNSTFV